MDNVRPSAEALMHWHLAATSVVSGRRLGPARRPPGRHLWYRTRRLSSQIDPHKLATHFLEVLQGAHSKRQTSSFQLLHGPTDMKIVLLGRNYTLFTMFSWQHELDQRVGMEFQTKIWGLQQHSVLGFNPFERTNRILAHLGINPGTLEPKL